VPTRRGILSSALSLSHGAAREAVFQSFSFYIILSGSGVPYRQSRMPYAGMGRMCAAPCARARGGVPRARLSAEACGPRACHPPRLHIFKKITSYSFIGDRAMRFARLTRNTRQKARRCVYLRLAPTCDD